MTPDTPYRFIEFWVPPRFRGDRYHWPTLVATLLAPIMRGEDEMLSWFVQEGPAHFQWCFAHAEPERIMAKVRAHQARAHFRTKRVLKGTLRTALCGDRWNARYGIASVPFVRPEESDRSVLLVKALDAICRLYVQSLVRVKRGRYEVEHNKSRQNRHHNHFESFMHLIANLSEARFNVHLTARSDWMHDGPQSATVVCHL